jgi:hypothetical protein
LQDDLLSIPGVEGAEIDGQQDAPAGLRIRIAEGADQEAVGGAIRRVLSSHGLGTDTMLPGEAEPQAAPAPSTETQHEPEPSTVAVLAPDDEGDDDGASTRADDGGAIDITAPDDSAVIDLTDKGPGILVSDDKADDDDGEEIQASEAPAPWERADPPPFVEARVADVSKDEDEPDEEPVVGDSISRIESVAVVEGRTGITVTVTASNGDEISHAASSSEGGVEAAVMISAARLVDPLSPDPTVIEIEDRRVEGVDIVMIVLDMDGRIVAGSAIVEAGRAFALGRATWAALAL